MKNTKLALFVGLGGLLATALFVVSNVIEIPSQVVALPSTLNNVVTAPKDVNNTNDFALLICGPSYNFGGNGDTLGRGHLTTLDITLVRRWLNFGTNFTSTQYARADMDGDGLLNDVDINLMRQVILGMLPHEEAAGMGKWISSRRSRREVPQHPNWSGEPGQIATDKSFLYVCVALDTWRRIPLAVSDW